MIDHAIVFGPVGAAVFWDEGGCHAVRLNDEDQLVNCENYLPFLLEDGTIEAQRLKDHLDAAKLQSSLKYWLSNHRALNAIVGTLDPSLKSEASHACRAAAETLIKNESTLHFVTCRLLGCRAPAGVALETAEKLSQDPNYPLYGWLIGLLKKNKDIIDIIAEFAERALAGTKSADVEKLSRELVNSGFLASHVSRIANDNTLTNLLERRRFDRSQSGNISPYEHPLLNSWWTWPYYVGRRSAVEKRVVPLEIADVERLLTVLPRVLARDEKLRVTRGPEGLLIGGQSEQHLNAVEKILEKEYQIELEASDPRVAYRELVKDRKDGQHTHRVIGQYARVRLIVEPRSDDDGGNLDFSLPVPLRKEFVRGIHTGIQNLLRAGLLDNAKVTVVDADYHEIDSSEKSFEIAAEAACRDALDNNTKYVEPVVKVKIITKERYVDRVVEDLQPWARNILVSGSGVWREIEATANMSRILGYHQILQELTDPGSLLSTQFDHYEVPQAREQKGLAAAAD